MLKRFTHLRGVFSTAAATFCGLMMVAITLPAYATYPAVVASATVKLATGMGDPTKVVIDPKGNLYTVSASNGNLYEVMAGFTTPVQIYLPSGAAGTTVTAVQLTSPGSGYTTAPTVTFSGGGGSGAAGTANLSNGGVTSITITSAGTGYTSAPTVTIGAPPAGGVQATGVTYTAPLQGLGGPHGLAVDSYGDVIVSGSYNYHLFFLQNKGGATVCVTCTTAGTTPLDLTASSGFSTLTDYYGATSDVAVDQNGIVYVSMSSCNSGGNICGISHNSVFTVKTAGPNTNNGAAGTTGSINTTGTATLFIGTLPSAAGLYAQNIAVDTLGHFYYADSKNVYMSSTTNPAPVAINPGGVVAGTTTGFTSPYGVSVDAAGDLFVSDNGTRLVYEIPMENGALNPAHQFIVAGPPNIEYGVAFDAAGNLYSADGYASGSIDKVSLGSAGLGSSAVGVASGTTAVTFEFNAATTISSFAYEQGTSASTEFKLSYGSCNAGAFAVASNCTANMYFTPSSTGLRRGSIVAEVANAPILSVSLSGTGTGAGLTADPATQTALTPTAGWTTPGAVAIDAAGSFYVADTGANAVQVFSAGGTYTGSIGTGLSKPGGVTVDAAGDVFIADTGNNRIVEVPNVNGTLNTTGQVVIVGSTSPLLSTGLNAPTGIFAGAEGGLYVADTGNKRVLRFSTSFGLSSLSVSTVGSGYTSPVAVTTDGSGNVYVVDSAANQVDKVVLMSGAQAVALSGLSTPTSVSVDASGALYVTNSGSGTAQRYVSTGGVFGSALTLGTGLATPAGVAVTGSGNVLVTDDGAAAVGTSGQPGYIPAVPATAYSLVRTGGTLYFGNVNYGLSATQAFTLTSIGSAAATLGTPAYTATGATADYSVTGVTCANGLSLATGASCTYSATLTPVVTSGTLTEALVFSSNAVNAAGISETLTGVATNLSLTTTTLALGSGSSSTPEYGQPVTVVATVVSQRAGVYPTGYVTFSLDGINQKPLVSLPAGCGPTVPCTASYTFPGLSLSTATHSIGARYSGDANNAGSQAGSAVFVTVGKAPSATTASVSILSTPATPQTIALVPGSTFYINLTASPTILGIPTGTAYLVVAGTTTPIAGTTVTLSASGTAQIPIAPQTPGTFAYQVVYSGDVNFTGSTSGVVTVTTANPTYTVAIPSSSYTVTDGGSVTIPITVTGIGDYAGNVTVGQVNTTTNAVTAPCVGLPQYVTCTFSPGIVPLGNGATTGNGNYPYANPVQVINLTLATSVPPAAPYGAAGTAWWPGALAGVLGLALLVRRRKGRPLSGVLAALMLAALGGMTAGLSGCGNGRGSSPAYVTPKGAATITVNFSGSPQGGYTTPGEANIPNSLSVQLTVQ